MSQAIALESKFENGQVNVYLQNTTSIGMKSTMPHIFSYGFMSVSVDNMLAEINQNSDMLQTVIGEIPEQDKNMSIDKGESVIYSTTWRQFMRNNGIQLQQIDTDKTAHVMMGEDTNKVIADLLKEVKSLSDKLNTFMNETFNVHTHAITDPTKSVTFTPLPIATTYIPSPNIATDTQYIDNNKNLATNNYTPKGMQNGLDNNNTK
jgi:hypothetical protein